MGNAAARARHTAAARAYLPGRRVLYLCTTCSGWTCTVTVDDGPTLTGIRCRTSVACPGTATYQGHPTPWPPDAPTHPGWEWYRPDVVDLDAIQRAGGPLWQHVTAGGLLLRARPA